ncbi:hypothetical protein PA2G_04072 [Pseudomonas aeruginosa 2192]|nr:hypothetical protein PA2G_04072 [Pseudomonas aeruginosa 2192]
MPRRWPDRPGWRATGSAGRWGRGSPAARPCRRSHRRRTGARRSVRWCGSRARSRSAPGCSRRSDRGRRSSGSSRSPSAPAAAVPAAARRRSRRGAGRSRTGRRGKTASWLASAHGVAAGGALGRLRRLGHLDHLARMEQLAAHRDHRLARLQATVDDHLLAGVACHPHRLQTRLALLVEQPDRRLLADLGQRRPGQHHAVLGRRGDAGVDHAAEAHFRRHRVEADLDLQRTAALVHRRGDLADLAAGGDFRLAEQADGDPLAVDIVAEQRLVDVEHRVALAVAGQGEDRHGGLHHLADLGLAGGDDPGVGGTQLGIGKQVAGVGQLRLGGLQRTLRAAHRGQRLVVLALAGVALGQQRLLPLVVEVGELRLRLLRGDRRLGVLHVAALVLRVEPRQHLASRDVVADIDQALDDLAADTERLVGLYPCLDVAGDRGGRGELGHLHRLRQHTDVFLGGRLGAATDKQAGAQDGGQRHPRPATFGMKSASGV